MSASPTGAVLLDSLGTLVRLEDPAPRLRDALASRGVEVSPERAAIAFDAEIAWYLDHHLEGRDRESLERLRDSCARVMLAELPTGTYEVVRESMLAALRFTAYPDAAPALRALRSAGVRLVVTSNWDCSLADVLDRVGLLDLLDGVVTSAEVGAPKPARRVFDAGVAAAGVDAAEAMCVGDSLDNDVRGALAAGVSAILLDRDGGPDTRSVDGRTVPVVRSLGEAASLTLSRR